MVKTDTSEFAASRGTIFYRFGFISMPSYIIIRIITTIQIKTKSVIPYLYVDSRKYSPLHRGCAITSSYNVDASKYSNRNTFPIDK